MKSGAHFGSRSKDNSRLPTGTPPIDIRQSRYALQSIDTAYLSGIRSIASLDRPLQRLDFHPSSSDRACRENDVCFQRNPNFAYC
ncbi:MAG TPA: hypothetical protein VL134_10020 [Leptolyngbya sp.]|nr:hypothetical protein [Leptolyngbya sp.]